MSRMWRKPTLLTVKLPVLRQRSFLNPELNRSQRPEYPQKPEPKSLKLRRRERVLDEPAIEPVVTRTRKPSLKRKKFEWSSSEEEPLAKRIKRKKKKSGRILARSQSVGPSRRWLVCRTKFCLQKMISIYNIRNTLDRAHHGWTNFRY